MKIELHNGNNIDVLKTFEDNSIDSIVTDPPYGLGKEPDARLMLQSWLDSDFMEVSGGGFMGKKWDAFVPQPRFWKEVYRVLKPGGHVLSFYGTRTYDWGVMAMRLAGFEIRDTISYLYSQNNAMQNLYETLSIEQRELLEMAMGNDSIYSWLYGSGFPKSLNIGKQIDKMMGNEREIFENPKWKELYPNGNNKSLIKSDKVAQAERSDKPLMTSKGNSEFEGWGTALKPAVEPIVLARKPISEKNIAENVLRWRTGGINIDECRVETDENLNGGTYSKGEKIKDRFFAGLNNHSGKEYIQPLGRFPANIILDGSDEVRAGFPDTTSQGHWSKSKITGFGDFGGGTYEYNGVGEKDNNGGSASRFFYTAKAHSSERNYGLEGFELTESINGDKWTDRDRRKENKPTFRQNHHPTVKPLDLMKYLVRLITPKGGVCLDAFMGSGTTGMACKLEGFDFIGIELETEYFNIAKARIDAVGEVTEVKMENGKLF